MGLYMLNGYLMGLDALGGHPGTSRIALVGIGLLITDRIAVC
jgi:hypothetical protein